MRPQNKKSVKLILAMFLIVALSVVAWPTPTRAEGELEANPAAEQYVLQQINAGRPADLANAFDNEADRVISAEFLAGVLRQTEPGLRVQSWGLDLRNATVVGDMLEYNVSVPFEVYFEKVGFSNGVFLNQFIFQKQVTFWECNFADRLDLSYSNFDSSLVLTNSTFDGPVSLILLSIARSLYASGTTFNGELTLVGSKIDREMDFSKAQFTSTEATADFDGITVGWKAFFKESVFAANARLYGAKFKFLVDFSDAQFTNPDGWASFTNAEIASVAYFDRTTFAGSVYFVNTTAWIVQMQEAHLTSTTASTNFALQAQEVYMRDSVFAGVVDFTDMEVSEVLDLSGSQFTNLENDARFVYWHVGAADIYNATFASSVDFSSSIFTEGVDLSGTQIDGQLIMSEVSIADGLNLDNAVLNYTVPDGTAVDDPAAQAALLDYLSVASVLSMKDTTILGPIDLSYVKAGHFFLEPNAASGAIARVDLGQVVIEGELSIKQLNVDQLNADSLTVAGPLNVEGLTINNAAILRNSNFSYVGLDSVSWPQTQDALTLDSMNYDFISVSQKESLNPKDESWRDSLDFINKANFSLDVYKKLESFFMEQGEIEAANAVFVAMRDRQAEQYTWLQPQRWWYLFLKIFILYGRGPQIAALWSALFIAIGAFVFRKKDGMDPAEMDDPAMHFYNSIWYSFDAFMPYIDLNMNTAWRPKADRRFANTYLRLHSIMGWVLIPIALLAIGGVI